MTPSSGGPSKLDYEGTGYRVQCADGSWSNSGGRQGACSGHEGLLSNNPSGSNGDGSTSNWCGASRDGDGDGLYSEGR